MKIRKLGKLNDKNEVSGKIPGDIATILTNNYFDENVPTTDLLMTLIIGQGVAAREIKLEFPVATEALKAQGSKPVSLSSEETFKLNEGEYLGVFIFRNQIFMVEAGYIERTSEEEAVLLIKKQVYSDDNKLKRLKQEVEVMERVINKSGFKRTPTPEAVKLLVYTRDEGKCVRCGSCENLHFDHIIPVSKGGGNSESNIQLLCEYCNLQKSDRIAF